MHKVKHAPVYGFKVLTDVESGEGTFEAIVAVFNNVDHVGDRILPGAFAASLEKWSASGDPIPVIFSHRWDDLDAHIGAVIEAVELEAGDERLPEEVKALGGLYVKATLDVDEDFAGRVWRKLSRRTLREFSFAYDVVEEQTPEQPVDASHRNDLVTLDVIEVGPTLKGCNPATALIGAKARSAKGGAAELLDLIEVGDLADVLEVDALERALANFDAELTAADGELEEEEQEGAPAGGEEGAPPPPPAADLEALDAALETATDELLTGLRSRARAVIEAAFVAASTTVVVAAGTVPGEDPASAEGKARPVAGPPATITARLDALELEVLTS
jgi:HK97 family phage prohead protease